MADWMDRSSNITSIGSFWMRMGSTLLDFINIINKRKSIASGSFFYCIQ